jgi:hypothetical protein
MEGGVVVQQKATYRHLDQALDLAIRASVPAAKHQAEISLLKGLGLIKAELVPSESWGQPPVYRVELTEKARAAQAARRA